MELAAEHTLAGWVGRVRQPDPAHAHAASARFTTWEGAVLATVERAGLRVGAGPALRRATVTWASGFCRCTEPEESSTVAPGAAAHAVATLPAYSLPVLPHLRVMARYYPSRDAPFSELQRTPTLGGLTVSIGVGVARRF